MTKVPQEIRHQRKFGHFSHLVYHSNVVFLAKQLLTSIFLFFSAEQLLTSYMDGNNECHLEMTDDQSSSGNSSSEKKVISDTVTSSSKTSTSMSSKKTLMTNLSGLKSEIDLSTQQLLLVPESRRKSL